MRNKVTCILPVHYRHFLLCIYVRGLSGILLKVYSSQLVRLLIVYKLHACFCHELTPEY